MNPAHLPQFKLQVKYVLHVSTLALSALIKLTCAHRV
jgi:hypothetical protein